MVTANDDAGIWAILQIWTTKCTPWFYSCYRILAVENLC